jgi:hypothetical protein
MIAFNAINPQAVFLQLQAAPRERPVRICQNLKSKVDRSRDKLYKRMTRWRQAKKWRRPSLRIKRCSQRREVSKHAREAATNAAHFEREANRAAR